MNKKLKLIKVNHIVTYYEDLIHVLLNDNNQFKVIANDLNDLLIVTKKKRYTLSFNKVIKAYDDFVKEEILGINNDYKPSNIQVESFIPYRVNIIEQFNQKQA